MRLWLTTISSYVAQTFRSAPVPWPYGLTVVSRRLSGEGIVKQPIGTILLAAGLLAAGLAGLVASWAFWPRTPGTSPLAALLSLLWSATYLSTALLTFRSSPLAAAAFVAAIALLLPLTSFIVPDGGILLVGPFVLVGLIGLAGYRYLRRVPGAAV